MFPHPHHTHTFVCIMKLCCVCACVRACVCACMYSSKIKKKMWVQTRKNVKITHTNDLWFCTVLFLVVVERKGLCVFYCNTCNIWLNYVKNVLFTVVLLHALLSVSFHLCMYLFGWMFQCVCVCLLCGVYVLSLCSFCLFLVFLFLFQTLFCPSFLMSSFFFLSFLLHFVLFAFIFHYSAASIMNKTNRIKWTLLLTWKSNIDLS